MPDIAKLTQPGSGILSRQPAIRWQDALPVGNGTIGALMYGNICHDTIVLNHEDLWLRRPRPELPDVSDALDTVRQLLREGRYVDAEGHLSQRLTEAGYLPRHHDVFHPAFDISVRMTTNGPFRDYARVLDFESGVASVAWRDDVGSFRRNMFVSHADDAVVLRIAGSVPFSAELALVAHQPDEVSGLAFDSTVEGEWLQFVATYTDHADVHPEPPQYGALGRVHVVGNGSVTTDGESVIVNDTTELVLTLKLFANEEAGPAIARLRSAVDAYGGDYTELCDRHTKLHHEMFRRARIEFADSATVASTDDLLRDAYTGTVSTALVQTMADFGRYLLVTSSCPVGLPANLQGVWNGDWAPPWQSDYHMDENIQMNYWAALPGNLTENALPMFSLFESYMDDYRENARKVFGCRGIMIPISQTTNGLMYTGAERGPWPNWTAGAGWIAQHFYDYWRFSGDEGFLRRRAVPFMREAALFYSDFLTDDENGTIRVAPSLSPENKPSLEGAGLVAVNATMDVAIIKELLTNLLAAMELLGIDDPETERWTDILDRLPRYSFNEDGAIEEWLHPDFPDNYHHRHLSHIYPLFPGVEIGPESEPELFDAVRVAAHKRLVIGLASQSGWSYAHLANVFARLGEGNAALESLELLLRSCTGPNLFTYHNDWRSQGLTVEWFGSSPPFQIDANFGFTAAVLEMLLASSESVIRILPALPDSWPSGNVSGLLTRSAVCVSMSWDMDAGRVECSFETNGSRMVDVSFPYEITGVEVMSGVVEVRESPYGARYVRMTLPGDETVRLGVTLKRN